MLFGTEGDSHTHTHKTGYLNVNIKDFTNKNVHFEHSSSNCGLDLELEIWMGEFSCFKTLQE